jgi:hypothetical protein
VCVYAAAQVKSLAGPVVAATVALYTTVVDVFLPTPRNCHYLFNMRDIAKVIQGVMQSDKKARAPLVLWWCCLLLLPLPRLVDFLVRRGGGGGTACAACVRVF